MSSDSRTGSKKFDAIFILTRLAVYLDFSCYFALKSV